MMNHMTLFFGGLSFFSLNVRQWLFVNTCKNFITYVLHVQGSRNGIPLSPNMKMRVIGSKPRAQRPWHRQQGLPLRPVAQSVL